MTSVQSIGIVAGGGQLPAMLADACRQQNIRAFVIALQGHADLSLLVHEDYHVIRLGAVGAMIKNLRQRDIRDLVWIGAVRRPSLLEMRPDWRAARFFAKLGLQALGDDGLLRAARRAAEDEGFRLHAVQDFLQDAMIAAGPLGEIKPDAIADADIRRGFDVSRAVGALDVGQAVVVQQGIVLGVEGVEGTGELIRRCGGYKRAGRGPVLIKTSKPSQDRALDTPAIGSETVAQCAAAGFCGVALEADKTLLIDAAGVARAADAAGIFIVGVND